MKITFAASEGVPFSKTGGLGDVIGALPQALAALGHEVTVYLPKYKRTQLLGASTAIASLTIPFGDGCRYCSVLDAGHRMGVRFYFIDYPPFFDRDFLYGTSAGDYEDNLDRFALYARAVIEASKQLGVPDVFHCHDWQAALIPVLLRSQYADDPSYQPVPVVFTIHNIGYQGLFAPEALTSIGMSRDLFTVDRLEFFGKVNLLKGAIVLSDFVTTVSRTYAKEIQSSEYGFGLEGVLRERSATVAGVLNGVDYDEWSPERDRLTKAQYSVDDLTGKEACKRDLLEEFGCVGAAAHIPVIGIVSRFIAQKGFDLIAAVLDRIAREELVICVLGSGEREYEQLFERMQRQCPRTILVRIAYDNTLAHKIEAGADMFLMPSRYEPCGLNQIYSLRYGAVPIVRATGGLEDTIEQWDPATGRGTGFKFSKYDGEDLLDALRRALATYRDKHAWTQLMRNGMSQDFSWRSSAIEYLGIFEAAKRARAATV